MSGDCRGFRQQRCRNRQHNQRVLKVVGEKAEKYSLRLLAEQTSLERSRRDRFNFHGGEMRSDEEFVLRATGENRVKNMGFRSQSCNVSGEQTYRANKTACMRTGPIALWIRRARPSAMSSSSHRQ